MCRISSTPELAGAAVESSARCLRLGPTWRLPTTCFSHESHPPMTPLAGTTIQYHHLELAAADGNHVAALRAVVMPGRVFPS